MKIRYFLCIILLVTLLAGCKKDEKETILLMTVDAETVWIFSGWSESSKLPVEYMLVQDVVSGEVLYMGLSGIEGFEYERGFAYQLKVKKTPPIPYDERLADYSYGPKYSLIEIISRTEIGDNGTVVSLIVSAEVEWVYPFPEQSSGQIPFFFVKEEGTDEWERCYFLYIQGFDYWPEFEYVLKVKKYPIEPPLPCEIGEIKFDLTHIYVLIEVISKTEKPEITEN